VPEVAEAAVVPDLYVSLKPGFMTNRELEERISGTVVTEISHPRSRPERGYGERRHDISDGYERAKLASVKRVPI
jgi:hypothetical protein